MISSTAGDVRFEVCDRRLRILLTLHKEVVFSDSLGLEARDVPLPERHFLQIHRQWSVVDEVQILEVGGFLSEVGVTAAEEALVDGVL